MPEKAEDLEARASEAGRLVIVGSGITAISHLTFETVGHIRRADVIFYHANSGVVATQIRELNPNAVDIYQYYGEGKIRTVTYVQMAELMLCEVRLGRYVVGLFHGHPGFFVQSGRRALAIAKTEGHATQLLPGISVVDCLLADLRIDPGVIGVQILKAGHLLREGVHVETGNHVILIQVNSVGDNTFSFSGYKKSKLDQLFGRLISIYGEQHDSIYYVAPIFPSFDPIVKVRKLGEYRDHEVRSTVSASTLYLPPAGVAFESLTRLQTFEEGAAYNDFEMAAIADLDSHVAPTEYRKRGASLAMMRVMEDLASSPETVRKYLSYPDDFAMSYVGLDAQERRALADRTLAAMRQATTDKYETNFTPEREKRRSVQAQAAMEAEQPALRPPVKLSMKWTPDRQSICRDELEFNHDGPTTTDPSHAIAHLLVAASGSLPWAPVGDRDAIKLAEYNAVFLEHLLTNTYNSVVSREPDSREAFSRTLTHARWFVEKHFAPFPILPEEAYCELCRHIDGETVIGLSYYFFEQKRAERADPEYKRKPWILDITSAADYPVPVDQSGREFKLAVKHHIMRMKGY